MEFRPSRGSAFHLLALSAGVLAIACSTGAGSGGGSDDGNGGQAGSEASGGSGIEATGGTKPSGSEGGAAGADMTSGGSGGTVTAVGGASATGGVGMSNTGGAAQTGGASTGGTMTSACATLLCSSFEDGTVTAPFRSSTSAAMVESLPAELARKGSTKAYHLRVTKTSTGAVIRARNFKHTGTLYGRMYFYMSRSHEKLGHTYLFRAGGTPNVEFGGQFGAWLFAPAGEISRFQKPFPSQKWACIQWEADPAAKSISVSVDGASIGKATSSIAYGPFDIVDVGYLTYHPEDYEQPLDVWIDDVALDDEPVPCL